MEIKFRPSPAYMGPMLIIHDWKYYIKNEQDINAWLNKCTPGWYLEGMVLTFDSDRDRVMFLLRWE